MSIALYNVFMKTPFAIWLLELLAERGLDQAELARQTKIDASTINKWINRGVRPTTEHCHALSSYLRLPYLLILERAGHPVPTELRVPDVPPRRISEELEQIIRRVREIEAEDEFEAVPVAGRIHAGQDGADNEDVVVRRPRRLKKLPINWQAFEVVGTCQAPEISPGAFVIVDPDIPWRPGQLIALSVAGGAHVKRLVRVDHERRELHLDSNEGPLTLSDEDARIKGVVIIVQNELDW